MNNNNVITEFIINVKLIFITYLAMEKLGLAQKVIYLSILYDIYRLALYLHYYIYYYHLFLLFLNYYQSYGDQCVQRDKAEKNIIILVAITLMIV